MTENTKYLTITESDKIELAAQDAFDMGDTYQDAEAYAEEIMVEERGDDWETIALWAGIFEILNEVVEA